MSNQVNNSNPFKSISLILLVVLLFTLVFTFINFSKNKQIATKFSEIEKTASTYQSKNELLSEIITIDANVIFEGNYKASINEYELLKKKTNDESLITMLDKRIENLSKLLELESDGDEEQSLHEVLLQQSRKTISQLEENIDSIQGFYNNKSDSLISQLAELNDELVASKSKKSSSNNNVKIISFKNDKGKIIHYLGEVVDEKANGGGVGIWNTGSIYKGDWKNNQRHGNGTFEWADGERYEGEYVNDKRKGEGTYYWPSGDKYEGEWNNDVREGYGTLYDFDGNIRFEGGWVNDKPDR